MQKLARFSALVAAAAVPFMALLGLPAAQAASAVPEQVRPAEPEAAPTEDPNLAQKLGDLAVATDQRTLALGHVDMGPKFVDGQWRLMIHDDLARLQEGASSVWRYPDQTVLRVADAGKLPVPEDPAYEFVGAPAGSDVWVIPQTQHPEVVWLGWNTQDPQVMERIDRGVTMSLQKVEGPGVMTMYLQSGSFGQPQVLWDSRLPEEQPIWVDVNTHTHSNWVFTAPGVYLVHAKVAADLIDGSQVSDTQVLRFAVGDSTSDADALGAQAAAPATEAEQSAAPADAPSATASAPGTPAPEAESNSLVTVLYIAIGVVALALVTGVILTVVRTSQARQREGLERARARRQEKASRSEGEGDN
ncbi:MAG: choice-of-anchor M domain-containing protein [Buchananella hordeovulneris]|nr:choice-of-anchor M domain-containing protein [Buchananella hordeovulneris]